MVMVQLSMFDSWDKPCVAPTRRARKQSAKALATSANLAKWNAAVSSPHVQDFEEMIRQAVRDEMKIVLAEIKKLFRGGAVVETVSVTKSVSTINYDELPSAFTVEVADPAEARENFAIGLGNLFEDDDDDIWDD